jgi:hypothetical protein
MEDGRVCYIKCEPLRRGIFSFENRSNCHQLGAVKLEAKRAARTAPFERELAPRGEPPAGFGSRRSDGRRKRCAHVRGGHPEPNTVLRQRHPRGLELCVRKHEHRRARERDEGGGHQRSHCGSGGSHGRHERGEGRADCAKENGRRTGESRSGVGEGGPRGQGAWSLRATSDPAAGEIAARPGGGTFGRPRERGTARGDPQRARLSGRLVRSFAGTVKLRERDRGSDQAVRQRGRARGTTHPRRGSRAAGSVGLTRETPVG